MIMILEKKIDPARVKVFILGIFLFAVIYFLRNYFCKK